MARILLFLVPILTFVIPQRFFAYYAIAMGVITAYVVVIFFVMKEETNQALLSFGVEASAGYIALNLALLGVRYWLIRRARERIIKLPAPKE